MPGPFRRRRWGLSPILVATGFFKKKSIPPFFPQKKALRKGSGSPVLKKILFHSTIGKKRERLHRWHDGQTKKKEGFLYSMGYSIFSHNRRRGREPLGAVSNPYQDMGCRLQWDLGDCSILERGDPSYH